MKSLIIFSTIMILVFLPLVNAADETIFDFNFYKNECGNWICESPENPINCPIDCKENDTVFLITVIVGIIIAIILVLRNLFIK